jgi:hypothetical protein
MTFRVLLLPGPSPAAFNCLTQFSTSERRSCFIGFPANGTDPAASDIVSTAPVAQPWRADHSPKNAANVIRPGLGSACVPMITAEVARLGASPRSQTTGQAPE